MHQDAVRDLGVVVVHDFLEQGDVGADVASIRSIMHIGSRVDEGSEVQLNHVVVLVVEKALVNRHVGHLNARI